MMLKILFWMLVALNLTDFWLTTLILKHGGAEVNPLQAWFIDTFGNMGILVFKAPFLLILGYSVYFMWDKLSESFAKLAEGAIWGVVGIYILLNLYSLGLYAFMLHK